MDHLYVFIIQKNFLRGRKCFVMTVNRLTTKICCKYYWYKIGNSPALLKIRYQ